ncbi:MAG TPA: ATP synthase F1 subunit gamma [candidate division Zixibacteria bacterium]|nr:ATP synthase F1 subunit gamma [candidate division Zixibacteria bacterium]MDD4918788.1 ATP synthase F1 subunit gamma [candidate division Zixibacteria bacterium]MDM7973015.1 ATP synthase F1 subunit gamma [candidate division Zixibacteria bacterium]HOD65982.1 ATP synthase F1 subunit gamma [candidate division Zixibacteria bacterium]HOZ07732.1 ATP synthase F1 subunit gamma [candidate division Zixibacteria bacterium]
MPTLRDVKKRIRSVRSTRRITGAMEMVAAAKLRRAQQKVEQTRPYADKLEEMLAHLAAGSSNEIVHPYFEERPVRKRTLVLFTGDRGFCGSYNANIIRDTLAWLRDHTAVATELVVIGKKGYDYFRRRPQAVVGAHPGFNTTLDYGKARDIVGFLTHRFVSGETDRIDLLYTRFLSLSKYRITLQSYLPIRPPAVGAAAPGGADYIFEPDAEHIYAALMPSYATTMFVTALVESFASELGSRMIAMNAATKNAGEMIDRLTLDYNKARQAQITKELLEVVSGAEALKG